MYVKLFNRILDSSIADNRPLRHFFIDLLLCADPDGNILMTKTSIAARIRCSVEHVEWGLDELMKPEKESLTQVAGGRRIEPLDGHGYGWKIINYEYYRDLKSAKEMRDSTAERVRKHREKIKLLKRPKNGKPLPGEMTHQRMVEAGITDLGGQPIEKDECPV